MALRTALPWLGVRRKDSREAQGWTASAGTRLWWAEHAQPKRASPCGEGTWKDHLDSHRSSAYPFPHTILALCLHRGSVVLLAWSDHHFINGKLKLKERG